MESMAHVFQALGDFLRRVAIEVEDFFSSLNLAQGKPIWPNCDWLSLGVSCGEYPSMWRGFSKSIQTRPNSTLPTLANALKLCPVNRTSITAPVDDEKADERTADAAGRMASARADGNPTPCCHCGEKCARGAAVEEGRNFCCLGCQTVFALLTESGLGQFYELSSRPGARVRETTTPRQWAFLDDPAVQEKLLDFADERQAKVTLHLPTIHCVACVWLLENLFRLQAGLGESRVNFGRREVSITFDRAQVKLSEIAALLASLGYEPALTFGELDQGESRKVPRWRQRQ